MRNTGLSDAEERFCEEVAKGTATLMDSVKTAFPKYKKATERAIKLRGNKLVKRHDIQARIIELREKQGARTEKKYAGLKDEMIDRLVEGIRVGTDGDPLTVVEFAKCIDLLAKMNGWYAPTDLTLRNGGFSADYRPPTLVTMTDAEITAKLLEIRGTNKGGEK